MKTSTAILNEITNTKNNPAPDFDINDFSVMSDSQLSDVIQSKKDNALNATKAIEAIKSIGGNPQASCEANSKIWDAVLFADVTVEEAANYGLSFQ